MKERTINVLFVGLKYDYGFPDRGYSYEYLNFYETLARMKNISVEIFPFDEIMRNSGREKMNRRLIDTVKDLKPDLCFFVLFTDEIKKDTILKITGEKSAVTVNWFTDDHWRFDIFSKFWADAFNYAVTTDRNSLEKYHQAGCPNAVLSQWGYNHHKYKPVSSEILHDVTFVGQAHSSRSRLIRNLLRSGMKVRCWGKGWPDKRLSHEEMVRVYSTSKINLNFSDSSQSMRVKPVLKVFLTRRADDSVRLNSPGEMMSNMSNLVRTQRRQIKGRVFEIPGSGGFLLSENAEYVSDYFVPGKEIAIFSSEDELFEKIRYFLRNDEERESIRLSGHHRAMREHTFERRFTELFGTVFGN